MPKGNTYVINGSNGYVNQEFNGSDYHIVDVKLDVPAGSTRSIGIVVNDDDER